MNLDFKTFLEGKKAWAASKSEILDFWKNLLVLQELEQ